MFLSLYTRKPVFDHLSPRCMHWYHCAETRESIWLMDLRPCLNYWTLRARGKELSLFMGEFLGSLGFSSEDHAALSQTPWRSLLVLEVALSHVQSSHLFCIDGHSILAERYLRGMSWQQWWSACAKIPWPSKDDHQSFELSCQRMAVAMAKLPLKTPYIASTTLSLASLRRRYGDQLVRVWQWAWPSDEPKHNATSLFSVAEEFPWQTHVFEHSPVISRCLDHVLQSFEQMTDFFKEDLLFLVKSHKTIDRIRVVSLKWKLHFDDRSCRDLLIRFRYPHPLHMESPHFHTVSLQASLSFEKQEHIPDEWSMSIGAGVIGWELSVFEKIHVHDVSSSFFENETDRIFQDFENKIKVPLYHYYLKDDWIPERSYCSLPEQVDDGLCEPSGTLESFESRLETARSRPLFILNEAIDFDVKHRLSSNNPYSSALWTHLERISPAWWNEKDNENEESSHFSGDYYRYVDGAKHLWLFRSYPDGKWYVRGFFG